MQKDIMTKSRVHNMKKHFKFTYSVQFVLLWLPCRYSGSLIPSVFAAACLSPTCLLPL
jgi:hypothetical protein